MSSDLGFGVVPQIIEMNKCYIFHGGCASKNAMVPACLCCGENVNIHLGCLNCSVKTCTNCDSKKYVRESELLSTWRLGCKRLMFEYSSVFSTEEVDGLEISDHDKNLNIKLEDRSTYLEGDVLNVRYMLCSQRLVDYYYSTKISSVYRISGDDILYECQHIEDDGKITKYRQTTLNRFDYEPIVFAVIDAHTSNAELWNMLPDSVFESICYAINYKDCASLWYVLSTSRDVLDDHHWEIFTIIINDLVEVMINQIDRKPNMNSKYAVLLSLYYMKYMISNYQLFSKYAVPEIIFYQNKLHKYFSGLEVNINKNAVQSEGFRFVMDLIDDRDYEISEITFYEAFITVCQQLLEKADKPHVSFIETLQDMIIVSQEHIDFLKQDIKKETAFPFICVWKLGQVPGLIDLPIELIQSIIDFL